MIINQYGSTPDRGMVTKHYSFARRLVELGHKVDLVLGGDHHLQLRSVPMAKPIEIEERDGIRVIYVRGLQYKHAHDRRRILNWLLFAWRVRQLSPYIASRPDAVLVSSPSLLSYLGAEALARKFKTRLCFEVRDIWPLSIVEIGGRSKSHPFIRLLQAVEDRAYRKSDMVISSLPGALEHMKSRGMNPAKFAWIPNGFTRDLAGTETPSQISVPRAGFLVGYVGTLGAANAMDTVLDAARLLADKPDISFAIAGDGKERQRLEQRAKETGLSSVRFLGRVPKTEVSGLLAGFDCCYIGWHPLPIYRFGISANKIPEYMISARPIIHGYSGKFDPVADADCGITVPAGDAPALADAIRQMAAMNPAQRQAMGERGRNYAQRHYDNDANAERLAALLCGDDASRDAG